MASKKDYCGIVFIGGGSSHSWAPTPEEAAKQAAKTCKRDWRSLYKFKRQQEFSVNVYDMREHDGWWADHSGVYDSKTKVLIPVLKVIKVEV